MKILTNVINTNPADTDYLKGSIRDKDLGFAIPGTPITAEIYSDIVEFFQKLLSLVGITANDLPDNETNGHQTLEALAEVLQRPDLIGFENLTFIQDLVENAHATNGQTSCAWINETDIAVADSDGIRTFRINGLDIDQVGSTFTYSPPSKTYVSICKIDTDKIAMIDSNVLQLVTYSWNGSVWSQVGNALSFATGYDKLEICGIDTDKIAFIDEDTRDLRTYEFDGSDWSQVGNSLNITGALAPTIETLETDRIVFYDVTNDEFRTYEFDGSDWSQVGNSYSFPGISSHVHIAPINPNDIVFYNFGVNSFIQFRFDGTDWKEIGVRRFIDGSTSSSIAAGNRTIIYIRDNDFRIYNRILNF